MSLVKVYVRRSGGGVEEFDDLDAARGAAQDGDIIGKVHRGGHIEYEAAVKSDLPPASGKIEFIVQPSGWRPRLPVHRG